MKSSLLVLITALDLEDHNVVDLVTVYKKFEPNISVQHLNLIFRRAMTVVLNRSGFRAVQAFLQELQEEIEINPPFLALCDASFKKEEVAFQFVPLYLYSHNATRWSI